MLKHGLEAWDLVAKNPFFISTFMGISPGVRMHPGREHRAEKSAVFDTAHDVLCKIGGEGLTELVNNELADDNYLTRRRGIADALQRPDDRTHALLRIISQSYELEGKPPRPVEQGRTLRVLAALGDDQAVIRGILRWGHQHVSRSILSYRTLQNPVEIVGLQKTLDLLMRQNNAKADDVLIAAGISRNRNYIPSIQEILKQALPESHTAWCAAIALMALGDKSEEFVELLIRLLATSENRFWAMQWLACIATSKALAALMQYLKTVATEAFGGDDWELALHLFQRQETRDRVSKLIVDKISAGNDPVVKIYSRHLEILPELGLENAYDLLLEEAFSNNLIAPERVVGAIRGLWKLDPSAALGAAELALKRLPQPIKDDFPGRSVEFAGEQAIGVLCGQALREESTATRWGIARALRLMSDSESLSRHIQVMLSSQNRRVQEAAVEICGWQPPGFMRDTLGVLAREDLYDTVSRKAIAALQRQEEQLWVKELMEEFRTGSASRRWSLLRSIIRLGDPFLLANRKDRLWIGQIFDEASEEYAQFAKEEMSTAKEAVLVRAKRLDHRS
jgi:hypothetical protein